MRYLNKSVLCTRSTITSKLGGAHDPVTLIRSVSNALIANTTRQGEYLIANRSSRANTTSVTSVCLTWLHRVAVTIINSGLNFGLDLTQMVFCKVPSH